MTAKPIQTNEKEVEEVQRGREATHLLNHPMITGALSANETYYEREWRETKIDETEIRENAFKMMMVSRAFASLLTKHIETGTLAEHQQVQDREQTALRDASA